MPKSSAARKSSPHPAQGAGASQPKRSQADESFYQQNLFLAMALNMTWQLALVVLIPIVGGYLLDQRLSTSPWLTLVGAALAAAGFAAVLYRVVAEAGRRSGVGGSK